MAKILVIHGPNLNLLGQRQPEIYGKFTLEEINKRLEALGQKEKIEIAICFYILTIFKYCVNKRGHFCNSRCPHCLSRTNSKDKSHYFIKDQSPCRISDSDLGSPLWPQA